MTRQRRYRVLATGDNAGSCRWGLFLWPAAKLLECFPTRAAADRRKRELERA